MAQQETKRREFLALIGSRAALQDAAKDPAIWQTFEDEWRGAQGAPWLLALAMWAGVEIPKIIEAMCAGIRAGIAGESEARALEQVIDMLETWARHDQRDATTADEIARQAEPIAEDLADSAWVRSGKQSHGVFWNIVFWAWAVEAAASYAFQVTNGGPGEVNWEVIKAFAAAVEGYEPIAGVESVYDRCAEAVRLHLSVLPQRDMLPEPLPGDSQWEGHCYVEVGFDDEAAWVDAQQCWLALRPARAMRNDPRDGTAIWDVIVHGMPSSEQDARDILTSLDQCEIVTGAAKRLEGKRGRLQFEPLASPYGGIAPMKWFAEAFHLQVLDFSE